MKHYELYIYISFANVVIFNVTIGEFAVCGSPIQCCQVQINVNDAPAFPQVPGQKTNFITEVVGFWIRNG